MLKQWKKSQRVENNSFTSTGAQQPANQIQRPIVERHASSRAQSQFQPYSQPLSRNPADLAMLIQTLDEVKKQQNELYNSFNSLQTM